MSEMLQQHFEEDEVSELLRLIQRVRRSAAKRVLHMARSGADFDEIWAYLRRALKHG